jgi:hypothetical protein
LHVRKCNINYSNGNKLFSVIKLLDQSEGPHELRWWKFTLNMHKFNSNYVKYKGVTDVQIYKIHYFLIQAKYSCTVCSENSLQIIKNWSCPNSPVCIPHSTLRLHVSKVVRNLTQDLKLIKSTFCVTLRWRKQLLTQRC